jgi:hypothetical protein
MGMKQTWSGILCAVVLAGAAYGSDAPVPANAEKAPSFRLDVEPVFFRSGCNQGGCHGAARGKDGFRLSLFSFDPVGDYFRLTQQIPGRRLNFAVPAESLLLMKATGKVPHTGGKLFDENSERYATLLKWVEAGAPDDPDGVAQATEISLSPEAMQFDARGQSQKTKVTAKYSDGTTRDVTRLALFLSNNKSTADIDADGVVTAGKPGATNVFARFAKFTVGAEVIVLPPGKDFVWPAEIKPFNYVDEIVHARLQKLRIIPSAVCTDEDFVRRVYLDVIGLLPKPAETEAFLKNTSPTKRAELVDALLKRDEFADLWAAKWSEVVRVVGDTNNNNSGADKKAALLYHRWIREQFKRNTPVDEFVRAQAAGTGSSFDNPPANYYTMVAPQNFDPKDVAQDTAQVFTGVRIQCAQCHNHPFDRWTQDDYYGFVSFFTGVRRKLAADPREVYVGYDTNAAPAKHPLDNRPMPPKLLGGPLPDTKGKDPRLAFADWLVSPENAFFRNNWANRVWEHFLGKGIVDPVDDFRISNPPSNRELIDALGSKLAEYKFDLRKLIRDVCLSRTYQLSATVNASNRDDDRQFSHAMLRRLRADVLLDAISQATETVTRFNNQPKGTRAVQVYDSGRRNGSYFLKTFGQATRETVNACENRTEPTFAQTLHEINGNTIQSKLGESTIIPNLIKDKKAPDEIINALYVRALSRQPSAEERQVFAGMVEKTPLDPAPYNDIFWALLNSTEFEFNH